MTTDRERLAMLPPLREVVAAHDLGARKALGQHFLYDLNLTERIVRAATPLEGATIVEIGPGPGGLTRALAASSAGRIIAIERDARFLPALAELAEAITPGRLQIVEADALEVDEAALLAGAPAAVVANLPYNVGTALLVKWLSSPRWWTHLVLMFQKEVAERITAPTGADAYGRLSVLAQTCARPRIVLQAPARAFTPPPKVDSAVVRLDPHPNPVVDLAALEAVTQAAFGQRRKMLRVSLKGLAAQASLDPDAWLGSVEIAPTARPETVSPEAFVALATTWRRAQAFADDASSPETNGASHV